MRAARRESYTVTKQMGCSSCNSPGVRLAGLAGGRRGRERGRGACLKGFSNLDGSMKSVDEMSVNKKIGKWRRIGYCLKTVVNKVFRDVYA